ncbi:MAG TPA: TonB family protein [Candidatus Binataceae bacterium]|nr:TonB family protein [Candidatus Binataceae bacterium]
MKTCPRCARSYPDAESFCEADGTALTAAAGAAGTAKMADASEAAIECPVCGGKAEPGELMCNFCGARLPVSGAAASAGRPAPEGGPAPARGGAASGGAGAGTPRRRVENYVPARDKLTATEFTPPPAPDDEADEESGRSLINIIGYSAAAIVALAAGAWLAIHLSSRPASSPPKTVEASPAATPSPAAVASGPTVDLAHSVQVQTIGESAAAPERSVDAARKVFDSGKSGLLDTYRGMLDGGSAIDDGMMVRLTVAPSGAVIGAAVRTSTSPNPELDAAAVKTMMGWTFAPINGGEVSADYPVIFARDAAQAAAIDSGLAAKVAALGGSSSPEYAFAPAAAPSVSPPPLEATAPVVATPPTPRRRRRVASARPPRPTLLEQVQSTLRSNRKLNRVNAYTNGGVVTLYGKVFDDNDKRLAVRTARSVSGVTDVIDQTTTDTSVWAARQQQISQALASAGLTGVTVKVIGHDAYLDGEVASDPDRQRAVTIAQGAAPVTVRTNLIRVAVGRVFGF